MSFSKKCGTASHRRPAKFIPEVGMAGGAVDAGEAAVGLWMPGVAAC